jgi:hypothetical protein
MPGEESTRTVIGAYQQLGQLETFSGDLEDARDLYQRCLLVAREFVQQKSDDPVRNQLLATTYMGLGYVQLTSLEMVKPFRVFVRPFKSSGPNQMGTKITIRCSCLFIPARDSV